MRSACPRWLPLLVVLVAWPSGAAGKEEKLSGYAEYRLGQLLVVDGQRVRADAGTRLRLQGEARSFAAIPLGYEVEVTGVRGADGVVVARGVEARPNKPTLLDGELRSLFDQHEARYRQTGRMVDADAVGNVVADHGPLYESGPQVERARAIAARVTPPYRSPADYRVYVVDNPEWNAMAAPNFSIYVFSGLLRDLDDDEVAIVVGHELAHASHEHSRRQFKRNLWVQLAAAGAVAVAEESIDDSGTELAVQVAAVLGASALVAGYGRDQEDQADRVGMRYAHQGGFDVGKGPRLWQRFAEKYGESPKVVNFFFGDHSRSTLRARKLQEEIAHNYAAAPSP